MHDTDLLKEADRLMTVCNSCRYCEGLCAVFPAMELRRTFEQGDLDYLANLCHNCGACYTGCQFSPPHEFNVNVPLVLSGVRAESYARLAWPRACSRLFERNGLAISLVTTLGVALFILGFAAWNDPSILFGVHRGAGAFYKLMPHNMMVVLFGGAFLYAMIAIGFGVRTLWRESGQNGSRVCSWRSVFQAMRDAATMRYFDGGGAGCVNGEDKPRDTRKLFHHFTSYGFLLCFAATSTATLYHYLLGQEAPYPWYDLPVVLGTLGGIGLLIGPAGLLHAKWQRDPMIADTKRFGMDVAFLVMLFATSASGMALLVFRETSAMGMLLSIHLGIVFSLFMTMPYGKFVHGIYRFVALVRAAEERRTLQ